VVGKEQKFRAGIFGINAIAKEKEKIQWQKN